MKKKQQSSFDKELEQAKKALENKTDIIPVDKNATDLIDMESNLQPTEDFMENRRAAKTPAKSFSERYYGKGVDMDKLKAMKAGPYQVPVMAGLEKKLHAPDSVAGKFIAKSQSKGKAFRGLMGLLSKAAPIAKIAGKAAGPLGFASDALASDDLGAGEDTELEQMKQEAMQQRLPQDQKLLDMKAKMAAMASKPLSPQDMLQNTTKPMIKQLGGPADINPRLAEKLLGEQESPDYESGLDPVKEMERRKRARGY